MNWPAPPPQQPPPPYMPSYPGMYLRPPRNPRQNAAVAAGVLVITAGIAALAFGNLILYWDAIFTEWDEITEQDAMAIEGGPLASGVLLVIAFGVSLVSAYACFRHERFMLATAGPVVMLVAYFSMSMDDWFILIPGSPMLVLSIVSLPLMLHARPIFGGDGDPRIASRGVPDGGAMPPGPFGPGR